VVEAPAHPLPFKGRLVEGDPSDVPPAVAMSLSSNSPVTFTYREELTHDDYHVPLIVSALDPANLVGAPLGDYGVTAFASLSINDGERVLGDYTPQRARVEILQHVLEADAQGIGRCGARGGQATDRSETPTATRTDWPRLPPVPENLRPLPPADDSLACGNPGLRDARRRCDWMRGTGQAIRKSTAASRPMPSSTYNGHTLMAARGSGPM